VSGFLLDTNVLSEFSPTVGPDPKVTLWLGSIADNSLYVSVLTLAEILRGIELLAPGRRRTQLEEWLQKDEADIERARQAGDDPGCDIMIHGLPNDEAEFAKHARMIDWTVGCIAVTDEEIEEIGRLVPDGTPIEMNP
jgi:hypothetical protein